MRFFPRNSQSRSDALQGSGHIGNKSTSDYQTAQDRFNRYRPDVDTSTLLNSIQATYGGSAG